jgi:hypothetical protein
MGDDVKERPEISSGTSRCVICQSSGEFDSFRDIYFCPSCGAHLTSVGWQHPDFDFPLCDACFEKRKVRIPTKFERFIRRILKTHRLSGRVPVE